MLTRLDDHNTLLFYQVESPPKPKPVFFTDNDSLSARDSKIWNEFRQGSREALDYIFKHHASDLFAYGYRFSKDQEIVMDCIQDLFVELWNRRQSLRETSSIKFYLLKSLRRRIARTLRGMKRLETVSDEAQYFEATMNFSAEHLLVLQETDHLTKARLNIAIEELTKRQRESIYLKFFHGLNTRSIAWVMGLSESSVHTLVSQSIKALRLALPKKL